jgi:S-adenosylmethionine:tRNA ribosyltransferase-isomerase
MSPTLWASGSGAPAPESGEAAAPRLAFELPPALRAGAPPEARGLRRDGVRLMVSQGEAWPVSGRFRDLASYLRPGDLLVVNTSATLPGVLLARGPGGAWADVRLATALGPDGLWLLELPLPAESRERPVAGDVWLLPGRGHLHLVAPYHGSARLWVADLRLPVAPPAYLLRHARPARPAGVDADWPLEDYQTCFAREPGSTAMASAGRPLTPELLRDLVASGVPVAPLLLHTSGVMDDGDRPLPEPYHLPAVTARMVNRTRAAGGRVVAVGTTVVRALETAAGADGQVRPGRGWTDLVVTPARGVRVVDGLLTGWHEPGGSHLHLLEAVAGLAPLEMAYRAALDDCYSWGAFGDVHLLLRPPRSRGRRLWAAKPR